MQRKKAILDIVKYQNRSGLEDNIDCTPFLDSINVIRKLGDSNRVVARAVIILT